MTKQAPKFTKIVRRDSCFLRSLFSLGLIFLGMMALSQELFGQGAAIEEQRIPLIQDWSSRHVIYPVRHTPILDGVASNPRYWANRARRGLPSKTAEATPLVSFNTRVDWAISLGSTGGFPIGETPAKYGFYDTGNNVTLSDCTNDFVVFVINALPSTGSNGQANIVALDNLYTGTASSSCPNGPQTPPTTDYTAPTFLWSYAAGSAAVELSPIISLDGKKIGYVDADAQFNVLTWIAGQGTDATHPVLPGSGGSSLIQLNYTGTAASGCSANQAMDSYGAPFMDYNTDSAYLTADNGNLYRITGVFKGTPTLGYCITVKANAKLTSPIYDQVDNEVYVSDGTTLYGFTPGASAFTASGSIVVGSSTGHPIVLAPFLDTGNGFVYVFSAADPTNTNSIAAQVNSALTSQVTAAIGPVATPYLLDGDFDNAYWATGPNSGAGTLYVCGTDAGGNGTKPSLYALSFSAPNGTMNSTPAMSDNRNINNASNTAGSCSPLLDLYDTTTSVDQLFVGVGNYSSSAGANQVTEWNVNTRIPSNTTLPNSIATGYWGGTSAFSFDNFSTAPQASSIYFGTLRKPNPGITTPCGAANYCAVKLTQSSLQ